MIWELESDLSVVPVPSPYTSLCKKRQSKFRNYLLLVPGDFLLTIFYRFTNTFVRKLWPMWRSKIDRYGVLIVTFFPSS